MLKHFDIQADNTIYIEHNLNVVKASNSIGIKTFHYEFEKDLSLLKKFLDDNLIKV